jgi:hypothetical protein
VGFVPSRKPVFTLIVLIDSPHAKGHTGGVAAAPVFKRIAEATLRHYGIGPSLNAPPPILIARREAPRPEQPASAPLMPEQAEPEVVVSNVPGEALFPDLRGRSARDALRTLAQLGMTARLHGSGIVIEQDPAPGAPIERGAAATLKLGRQPTISLASATQP